MNNEPIETQTLTVTLGAEGIAALEVYRAASMKLRATSITDAKAYSLQAEDCQREGYQLARHVLNAAG